MIQQLSLKEMATHNVYTLKDLKNIKLNLKFEIRNECEQCMFVHTNEKCPCLHNTEGHF